MKKNSMKRFTAMVMASSFAFPCVLAGLPVRGAVAEDTVFPYTLFASSSDEGAITVNAYHLQMNGSMGTNGTITTNCRANINGFKTENAETEMPFIGSKLNNNYFLNANTVDNYTVFDQNVNINAPLDVIGNASINGNLNMNSFIMADEDITVSGNVSNINNSVIYSEFGDIIINSDNVNLTGIVYAPLGNVVITANNINLNNVVIIADTITLNANNVNANYSRSYAQVVGNDSEAKLSYIKKYNSYLMDKESENILSLISNYYTVTPIDAGEFSNIDIQATLAPGYAISMNFEVEQYDVEGYGNLSIMKTDGFQQMSTIVLTPYYKDMPMISTDYMFNGESRTSYVEFYGLGIDGDENMPVFDELRNLTEKYSEYTDKAPAAGWYDAVRTMGLFKYTDYKFDDAIENMLYESFDITLSASMETNDLNANQRVEKHNLIQSYVDNLINNPGISTSIFNMCLGKEATSLFFNNVFFGLNVYKP